jgi:hypothetical protein
MDETTSAGSAAGGLPPEVLTLVDEHRAAEQEMTLQEARWAAHVEALFGVAKERQLPMPEALSLIAEHRATVELMATQTARWSDHVDSVFHLEAKAEPMADPAIVAYYKAAARSGSTRPRSMRKERETKAWELLRQKLTPQSAAPATTAVPAQAEKPPQDNLTRSETMSKEEATPSDAPAADTTQQIDWGDPAADAGAVAAAEKARFEQAKKDALADPRAAKKTDAGRFALAEAKKDRKAQAKVDLANAKLVRDDRTWAEEIADEPGDQDRDRPFTQGDATNLAKAHIEAIRSIQDDTLRQQALADSFTVGYFEPLYKGEFAHQAPDLVEPARAASAALDAAPAPRAAPALAAATGRLTAQAEYDNTIEPAMELEASPGQEAKRMHQLAGNAQFLMSAPAGAFSAVDAAVLVADDLKLLEQVKEPALRERALWVLDGARQAQATYDDEFARQAPQLKQEMADAVAVRAAELAVGDAMDSALNAGTPIELNAEQVQQQEQQLSVLAGTASALMRMPADSLTGADAASLVARDVAALSAITEPHMRIGALLAVEESRHAQPAYRAVFDSLSRDLAVEARAVAVERFGEEYVNARALPGLQSASSAAMEADRVARAQALDAAVIAQLDASRTRDRQAVAAQMGWTANMIERDEAIAHAPVSFSTAPAPTQPSLTQPAAAAAAHAKVVPPQVEQAFQRVGDKFYMPKNKERVAFEDHGLKLKTVLNDSNVALAMVQIAHARGWTSIKVSGTPEFRQQAWRDAALLGIAVKGYEPTELDKADLARRIPVAANEVARGAVVTAAPAPAPVMVNSQAGIFISAEDAALLAAAKAALQRERAAAPAAAAVAGMDVLVAHGPAKYRHDPTNADSYFVTLSNSQGKERTVWGVGLGKAIAEAGVQVGQPISLELNGKEHVEVEAKMKDDAGQVVGLKKIGALRNEWTVKGHALATQPPEQAAVAHPDLAGVLGKLAAVDKRAQADGFTPAAREIIAAHAREIAAASVGRGHLPRQQIREAAEVMRQPQPQQEMAR